MMKKITEERRGEKLCHSNIRHHLKTVLPAIIGEVVERQMCLDSVLSVKAQWHKADVIVKAAVGQTILESRQTHHVIVGQSGVH